MQRVDDKTERAGKDYKIDKAKRKDGKAANVHKR
jgi:hypothetical protein